MNDDQMKCAMVSRMWRDNIVMGVQYADVESVARQAAIPTSEEGSAKDLLRELADDPDVPVVKTGANMVALKRDADAVGDYLRDVCDMEAGIPWDLR